MRDSFIFYKSFVDALNNLDDETRLQCYDAISKYAITGEEPDVHGVALSIFSLIKPQLDANNKRYENGRKGGKKPNDNQNVTKAEPKPNQTETKAEPNENVNVNENDNENVNENVNEKGNGVNIPPTPPTGGAPRKAKRTALQQNTEYFEKLVVFCDIPPDLEAKARDWITYKGERKEPYTETGMRTLLNKISDSAKVYGPEEVIRVIDECIGNNYKGIIWDRLKKENHARGSGSAYLDRIDNRYQVVDDWLSWRQGKDDTGTVFDSG